MAKTIAFDYDSIKNRVITNLDSSSFAQSYNNIFTAKSLGEAIGLGSKVVSGSMRKLVLDGFFEKIGANPVSYAITEKGLSFNSFDN